MACEDRIETLRNRHNVLDDELHEENARPHPDPAVIAAIKKQKLRLKDEIMRLAR